MKASDIGTFRKSIMLTLFVFVACLMFSKVVYATELTDSNNNSGIQGNTFSVCLAAGAYDKESVVSLEEDEVTEEEPVLAEGAVADDIAVTSYATTQDVNGVVAENPDEELEVTVLESDEEVSESDSKAVFAKCSDSVNVRKEPSEDAEKAGKLFKNCSGTLLDQKDDWSQISSGNLIGWVKSEYLYFGKEAEDKIAETGTLKATIQTDALRIRKEASEDAGVYKLAKNGDSFVVTEELDGWVAVKVDKDTVGYISAEFAKVEFTTEKAKTIEQIEAEEKEKEKKKLSKNRGAVASSVSETALLAALIQAEAGSQPYEGQLAVGAVVMNRVRSRAYPNSVQGVITQRGQFPPAVNGTVANIAARGAKASCVQAAKAAINGESNIGGAMHFGRVGKAPGIVIGAHVFY